jgi:hypothetical protein
MKEALEEIQKGEFAREWVLENQAGRPVFHAILERDRHHLIEKVGEELRKMMPLDNGQGVKMNLTKRREVLKKFYTPLGVALYRLHFPPNFITLMSVITGMLSAYFFWHGKLLTAVVFLLLSGLLDLMDGVVARLSERASKFGAVFDWLADKWVDSFVLGTVGYLYAGPFTATLAITASMLHSFIKPVVYSEIGFSARVKGKIQDPLEGVGFFGRP